MGVRTSVKNQKFAAWKLGRRFALGAVTLALVVWAADQSGATAASRDAERVQARQSSPPSSQAAPAKPNTPHPPQRLPWWKDLAIIKEISLTPDQSTRIDAIWRKRETDMKSALAEYTRQKDELDRLMAERKVGVDVIGVQHDRVEAQRTTLNKSRAIALYQSSLILSAEQNRALKIIGDRNRRERR